jgi:alkylation response protein AidB-like acyl-CoA dehydrogenase
MDFGLTDRQRQLQERVYSLCAAFPMSVEGQADATHDYPEDVHKGLCEEGILGHCLPGAHGGGDGGFLDLALIAEGLGAQSNIGLNIYFVNMAVATLLARAGSDAQKRKFLDPLVKGRFKGCFSLTEPNAGSDAASIECEAVRDGDHYSLTGTKLWATGAAVADAILVVARTDRHAKGGQALSMFMIPANAERLIVTPIEKLAGNAIASCELTLQNVRVASEARIGAENDAWRHLVHTGAMERLTVAAGNLGAAQAVFDLVVPFARDRRQFGQPIASFQSIQHQLVDMATEIEAMRWLVYSTAWKHDQGEACAKEISMAKLYTTERLNEIVMRGMRIFGGCAYRKGHPMERKFREALLSLYAGGTGEIQRNIIARHLGLLESPSFSAPPK